MSKLTSIDLEKLMIPIPLEDSQEIDKLNYLDRQRISYQCKNCRKPAVSSFVCFRKHPFVCKSCKNKETLQERYGSTTYTNSKDFLEKRAKSMLDKYGVLYTNQSETLKAKQRATMIKLYGEDYAKMLAQKTKQSCIAKYGTDSANRLETKKTKSKKTKLQKYENGNYDIRKYRETCLQRYGVSSSNKDPNIRLKQQTTKREKYGSPFGPKKVSYQYQGMHFDSSWELMFYIYHKDLGNDVKREPVALEYEVAGEKHLYYPDFSVNGILYEIKGSQFLNEQGQLVNAFWKTPTALNAAKQLCMQSNGVKLVTGDQIVIFKEYIDQKYSKTYIESFRS